MGKALQTINSSGEPGSGLRSSTGLPAAGIGERGGGKMLAPVGRSSSFLKQTCVFGGHGAFLVGSGDSCIQLQETWAGSGASRWRRAVEMGVNSAGLSFKTLQLSHPQVK